MSDQSVSQSDSVTADTSTSEPVEQTSEETSENQNEENTAAQVTEEEDEIKADETLQKAELMTDNEEPMEVGSEKVDQPIENTKAEEGTITSEPVENIKVAEDTSTSEVLESGENVEPMETEKESVSSETDKVDTSIEQISASGDIIDNKEDKKEDMTNEKISASADIIENMEEKKEDMANEKISTSGDIIENMEEKKEDMTNEKNSALADIVESKEEKEDMTVEQNFASADIIENKEDKKDDTTDEQNSALNEIVEKKEDKEDDMTFEQVSALADIVENNEDKKDDTTDEKSSASADIVENKEEEKDDTSVEQTLADTIENKEAEKDDNKYIDGHQQSTHDEKEQPVESVQEMLVEPQKETYESAFEKFLNRPAAEPPISDSDSKSSEAKTDSKSEAKPAEEEKKAFNPISSEETSNSSWYKMPENKEETMDVTEAGLLGDENSNLSIPENGSVISSNIGENSLLSYQVDEGSNLSVPEDGNSVPKFSGHQPVFDESANMNPPSNVTFVQPDTPTSVNADTTMSESTPTAKRNRRGTLQLAAEEANEQGHNITASDIFEYQWPQEPDGDWYILQEQISVYLDVKSFKRKYPEIFRRVCDKLEKDFLRENCVVTETQSDLGLTALKSEDVHDLMSRDYPAKYKEFLKILHDREKKRMAEKMKEYDAPRLEKEKMLEYTKNAMKSASEWNKKMLKERSKERRAYFDMQSFAIQYPKSKFRKLGNIKSSQDSYPVSLIPGQFQEYYKKYSSSELKHFPLNTTVFTPPKKMNPLARLQEQIVRRQQQQLALQQSVRVSIAPVVVVQEDTSAKQQPPPARQESESDSDNDSSSGSSSGSENETANKTKEVKPEAKRVERLKKKEKSSSREGSKEKSVEPIVIKKEVTECRICKDEKDKSKIPVGEGLINCSECNRAGHPSCLDLTDEMLKVIKTYPWQCMECKTCVQCMEPYDEDKMLFCDNCDRGYHTFCVGLKSLPTGKWECKSCTGDTTPITPLPRPPPKAKRGRKPKDPNAAANQASTPGRPPKDKDTSSKVVTPTRMTPRRESTRREAKEQEKANAKEAKDPKEAK